MGRMKGREGKGVGCEGFVFRSKCHVYPVCVFFLFFGLENCAAASLLKRYFVFHVRPSVRTYVHTCIREHVERPKKLASFLLD